MSSPRVAGLSFAASGRLRSGSVKPAEAANPKSGAAVEVPAKKAVHFKPGRQIFKALNGDSEALSALQAEKEKQRRWLDERSGQLSLF